MNIFEAIFRSHDAGCWFGWHDWSKWVDTNEEVNVKIRDFYHIEKVVEESTYEIQRRSCLRCGKKQIRRERR